MGGVRIKEFLAQLERMDRDALSLLKHFRLEERGGKILLITRDLSLKRRMEENLLSLDGSVRNGIELIVEEEEEKGAGKAEGLSDRFSFDNFVVGEGNRLAYEVALEVARRPGKVYNPLFIYGGVGLGKTHLLHAIGNACFLQNMKVVYTSSTDFSENMVEAIKEGRIKEFRDRYREVDVLLLDDVQFLSGKERTQIEFFNLFNHMFLSDKQIVLASDRHPKELRDVSDRLVSRFGGGLVVEIRLDRLTKLEIIRRKLRELGVGIGDEVAESLAKQVADNVRDIEGAVRVLKLGGSLPKKKRNFGTDTLEKIKTYTAVYFGVKPEDLLGNRRSKRMSKVRHITMYLCRKLTDASLIEIARAMGKKDHSTVIHAIRKVEEERRRDRKLNHILLFLEKHISSKL